MQPGDASYVKAAGCVSMSPPEPMLFIAGLNKRPSLAIVFPDTLINHVVGKRLWHLLGPSS